VVVDGIGGPMVGPLLDATATNGRVVVYGNSADAESSFRVERFYSKGVTIYGFRVFASVPPDQGVKDMAKLADQAASGALSVKVQATAPLAEALPLIADLYDRKVTGKVVLTA
jgi:NADPH:quinone reductase-like Zn-dependent oxidoreductase